MKVGSERERERESKERKRVRRRERERERSTVLNKAAFNGYSTHYLTSK